MPIETGKMTRRELRLFNALTRLTRDPHPTLGSIFGFRERGTATSWWSADGSERLVRHREAKLADPKKEGDASEESEKVINADHDHIPSGAVVPQDELLAVPIHINDGSVYTVTSTVGENADRLAAILRTRRDIEALVIRNLYESGMPVPVPASRDSFRRKLQQTIEEALNKAPGMVQDD